MTLAYFLLAKAVLCTVSVVKGGLCSGSRYKQYDTEVFLWLLTALFGKSICLPFYIWKNDTGTSEKYPSRVLQVKSSLECIISKKALYSWLV